MEKKKQWQQQQQTAVGTLSLTCVSFFLSIYYYFFFFVFFHFFRLVFFFFFSNLCVVGEQEEKKKTRNESIISSFKCASLICIASGKSDFKNCVTACIPAKDWATQPKVVKRSHETREDKKIKKKKLPKIIWGLIWNQKKIS